MAPAQHWAWIPSYKWEQQGFRVAQGSLDRACFQSWEGRGLNGVV